MNKIIMALGVLLIIVTLVAVFYKVEVVTGYETVVQGETLQGEEKLYINDMKSDGWLEVGEDISPEELSLFVARKKASGETVTITGDLYFDRFERFFNSLKQQDIVLMVKITEWEYYLELYPYRNLGIILGIVGFCIVIIGTQISNKEEKSTPFNASFSHKDI